MSLEYKYRVAITKNRKLYRVIQDYKRFKHAENKFNKIKPENQILFPKIFTNYSKISKTKYELVLLKRKSDGDDTIRKVLDENGRFVKECSEGNWVIVERVSYDTEEEFYVYGLKERLNVALLLKKVFVPRIKSFYSIVMVLNKIVVYNNDDIEVILCKNLSDCRRLYDFLFDFLSQQGINNLTFFGNATKGVRSSLYDRMQEHTGLTRRELYRTSTRS